MMRSGILRALAILVLVAACAEAGPPAVRSGPRDLRELVLRDSLYREPGTMTPYTGRVFRPFPGDSTRVEIEGGLAGGDWDGEMIVYHPSGRIRYKGEFVEGERCGPWTENTLDLEPLNDYGELLSEIESMAMYPPCPPDL